MFLVTENDLYQSLLALKKKYKIKGIKAEFEAEGSNNENISKLRALTNKASVELHVKIGGVEAINDIYFCIESGVDGIIAPMVETGFSLVKFTESIKKLKLKKKPFLSINIESKTGLENIDDILKRSNNFINNITVGRSDLSMSYFDKTIDQNSQLIQKNIFTISKKAKKFNISCTVGGGVNKQTVDLYKNNKNISLIKKIETRKVIFEKNIFLKNYKPLYNAIDFETKYILYKKEILDFKITSEISRLTKLTIRK